MKNSLNKANSFSDFRKLDTIADRIKQLLEDFFGKVYITIKPKDEGGGMIEQPMSEVLKKFEIQKKDTIAPVYSQLNSPDDWSELRKKMEADYKEVVDRLWGWFDKIESLNELDDYNLKAVEIIVKKVQKGVKKIESKFNSYDPNRYEKVADIQKELGMRLSEFLKGILNDVLPDLRRGLLFQEDLYKEILVNLNQMLGLWGVYTRTYDVGYQWSEEEIDHLNVSSDDEDFTSDKSLKDTIKDVEGVAYFFDEKVLIKEADVTVWRIS